MLAVVLFKIIKINLMKYEVKYKELEAYLTSLPEKEFQNKMYNPNGIIKEAELINYIEHFKIDVSKLDPAQIVNYGMPFMVDALGNDLSVCFLSRRKYKLPTGRVVSMKLGETVIDNCRKVFGTPLNGCWVIPQQFVILK